VERLAAEIDSAEFADWQRYFEQIDKDESTKRTCPMLLQPS
jgi:hypothetical protein